MLVVFVGALIVLVMVTNALSRAVRASPLNRPDRILGAGFGVICAWAAMGTAFLFYTYLGPKPLPPVVEGGATFPLIREMADSSSPTCRRASAHGSAARPISTPARSSCPRSPPRADTKPPQ